MNLSDEQAQESRPVGALPMTYLWPQPVLINPSEPEEQDWAQADAELKARKREHLWPLSQKIPIAKSWMPLVVYALITVVSFLGWQNDRADWTISRVTFWQDHEIWRALLACFVHADVVHLLANAPLFIVFGTLLYGYFGLVAFPLLAFVAGALANAVTVLFYSPQTELLGASGVNYAMVGMWLVYFLARGTGYRLTHRIMRALAFALVILIPTTYEPRVSYAAHAWGFVFGIGLALAALRWIHEKPLPRETYLH